MNKMKKITTLCIAIALMFMTTVSTRAIGDKFTLTIVKEGSEFDVYKVLDAKKSGEVYVYTVNEKFNSFFTTDSPRYGSYTFDPTKGILKDGQPLNTTAADKPNVDNTNKPTNVVPSAVMAELTKNLQKYIDDKNIQPTNLDNITSNTSTALDAGYYLVTEVAPKDGVNGIVASKAMLVDLVKNYTIYPKDAGATLDKVILENGTPVEENDAGLGETIKYKVTATIPTYDSSVNIASITYKFTDTMDKGLTYNNDMVIKLGAANLESPSDFEIVNSTTSDGKTELVVNFTENGKTKLFNNSGVGLTLTYSATLTNEANVSSIDGNKNHIKLEYTNNPNIDSSYTILQDEVVTYSYGFEITKVDADALDTKLSGVTFKLYKENGTDEITTLTTDESGLATFTHLDAGTYILKEISTKSGYSLLETPIKIVITPKKVGLNQNLIGEATIIATNVNGENIGEVTVDEDTTGLLLGVTIQNHKGISLPGTGGIGTKGFLMIGGALVLIAGGLFIASEIKRKKELDK